MLSAIKVASRGSSGKVIYISWGNFPDIDVRPSLPALSACQCGVSLGLELGSFSLRIWVLHISLSPVSEELAFSCSQST